MQIDPDIVNGVLLFLLVIVCAGVLVGCKPWQNESYRARTDKELRRKAQMRRKEADRQRGFMRSLFSKPDDEIIDELVIENQKAHEAIRRMENEEVVDGTYGHCTRQRSTHGKCPRAECRSDDAEQAGRADGDHPGNHPGE